MRNNFDENKNGKEKISDVLSLPKDVVLSSMIVKITGNSEIIVENYCNIVEYNGNIIKLQGKKARIIICGKRLVIERFADNSIILRGKIEEIKFI